MVLDDFDSIKAKEAIAIAVRNLISRRNFKWVSAFCVFLFILSLSSTCFSFLRLISRQLVPDFKSHFFVFIFLNATIFIVYSLSGFEKRVDSESSPGITAAGELPEAPVDNRNGVSPVLSAAITEEEEAIPPVITAVGDSPTGDSVIEKRRVYDSNVNSPVAIDLIKEEEPISSIRQSDSVMEIGRYRRTESEKYEQREEKKKLRRTKTERTRETARLSCLVEDLDMDDFNRTIESFIEEKKFLQREEFRKAQIILAQSKLQKPEKKKKQKRKGFDFEIVC